MCHEKLGTRGPELVKATRGVEGGSQSKSPQRDSSIGPDFAHLSRRETISANPKQLNNAVSRPSRPPPERLLAGGLLVRVQPGEYHLPGGNRFPLNGADSSYDGVPKMTGSRMVPAGCPPGIARHREANLRAG